jgi:hypothetical protein
VVFSRKSTSGKPLQRVQVSVAAFLRKPTSTKHSSNALIVPPLLRELRVVDRLHGNNLSMNGIDTAGCVGDLQATEFAVTQGHHTQVARSGRLRPAPE